MASIISINVHPGFVPANYLQYRLPDGKVVVGINATEIVQAMADEKMSTPRSLGTYRRSVARRLGDVIPDTRIETSNNKKFVDSLVNIGQLTKL